MKLVSAQCYGKFTLPLWSAWHGAVALAAALVVFWLDKRSIWLHPAAAMEHHGRGAALASLCAAGLVAGLAAGMVGIVAGYITAEAMQRWLCGTKTGRSLFHTFRLPPRTGSTGAMVGYACTVGACEEVVFRGALQPYVGLYAATALFALLHLRGAGVESWSRMASAALLGGLAGLLYESTAHLMAPILCHVVVNYRNMHLLAKWTPASRARSGARLSYTPRTRWSYTGSATLVRIGGRVASS